MTDKSRVFEGENLPCFNCGMIPENCHCTTPTEDLKAAQAALVEALEAAKFRLFGAGPSTDPLYATIRDALAKAKGE